MSKKICVVTGTRADYGHLYWLLHELQADPEIELQLIATGMHLSPEFGLTYREILADGFAISRRVEMLLSSDTEVGISTSIGLGCVGFSRAYDDLKPHMVVVLGDRFEILAASVAALIARIPLVHIHGGEATEGVVDNQIRHAITKIANIHFPVTAEYRRRVIQMGENPELVFNCGAPGLDHLYRCQLLTRDELEEALQFQLGERTAVCTYHPVTLEADTAEEQIKVLLKVLWEANLQVIFTKANSDTYGRIINHTIEQFVARDPKRFILVGNLGQLKYLSVLQNVNLVIGNSSSGIIEAPSFRVPVVNIGDRQKGRIRAQNIIDVEPVYESILAGVDKGLSQTFVEQLSACVNPYDLNRDGKNSWRIKEVLKNLGNTESLVRKQFCDWQFDFK